MVGSPNRCTPIPTFTLSGPTSRPKISQMQISADRFGSSSYPIIHSATMLCGSSLEQAVLRRVQPGAALRLADDGVRVEPVLADRAADRAGEHAGLQRRDSDLAVELGTPWRLVPGDQQPQAAIAGPVPRRGSLAAAPVRQVVGEPALLVEAVAIEGVLELKLVPGLAGGIEHAWSVGAVAHARPSTPSAASRPVDTLQSVLILGPQGGRGVAGLPVASLVGAAPAVGRQGGELAHHDRRPAPGPPGAHVDPVNPVDQVPAARVEVEEAGVAGQHH